MKDNKKITKLILVLVLMITAVISGTFAYWQWITSEEQQTLVNVSLTDDATIYIDFPENELTNLYPTTDCEANGTSSWVTDITVNNGTGVKLATNFKLKIKIEDKDGNVITNGTNEWNDHDFKYYVKFAVTEANESCKNALYTGRFDTNNLTYQNVASTDPHYAERTYWYDSSSITLKGDDGFPVVSSRIGSGVSFHALPNTETSHTYKVWVWLDEDYTSVTVGNDSTLDKLQDAKITVSWSENSELEQIRETATPEGEAIAIYSEDDNSLRFYRETNPSSVTEGSTYNGRTVTKVYTGFENTGVRGWDEYTYQKVIFEDYIYPTNTSYWFSGSPALRDFIDVTKLDTSNVTNMSWMFSNIYLNTIIGLENWDTSNVTNMDGMFVEGGNWVQEIDLSHWNVCNVTNYDSFAIGMYTRENLGNVIFPYFGDLSKCNGGNPAPNYNPRAGEAYAVYSADDQSLRFYRSETPITAESIYNGRTVTKVYTGFEDSNYFNEFDVPWFEVTQAGLSAVTSIIFEDYIYPTNTAQWFRTTDVLSIDVIKLDTSNVTDMTKMFFGNGATIVGLETWNTSNVTNMDTMFTSFYGDFSGLEVWDVSNVTNMNNMFSYANIKSNLDLSNWNVCNVSDFEEFFAYSSGNVTSPFFGNTSKCNGGNPA